jgi:DNA-binding transcriptional regulator YhcF (GntR family)
MFVADGARKRLLARRRAEFAERYIGPMLAEAARLGIDDGELIDLINQSSKERAAGERAIEERGGVSV